MEEMRDRYGPPPVPVLNLADYGRIRVLADGLGIESIEREGTVVAIRFREKAKVDPMRVVHLVRRRADLQLIPPVTLKMDLKKPPAEILDQRPAPTARAASRRPRAEPAWWTARATTGTVEAGFSKAEILKPKEEDPRAPGGILQRATELLEDLSDV
jgi:hypothetical protein